MTQKTGSGRGADTKRTQSGRTRPPVTKWRMVEKPSPEVPGVVVQVYPPQGSEWTYAAHGFTREEALQRAGSWVLERARQEVMRCNS